MKTMQKRVLSLLLCVMLAITMLPVNVLADSSSAAPAQLSALTAGDTAGNPAGQPLADNADGGTIAFDNPFGGVKPGDWFLMAWASFTPAVMIGTERNHRCSVRHAMSQTMLV